MISREWDAMKCLFIYNPHSGKGKIAKHLDYIVKRLHEKFEVVETYQTKSSEDTINVARESCGKYDALVFSGGDGTFNDVVTGVAPMEKRPILGYIPSGTVNDIARNLSISRNIKKACDVIVNGKVLYHDVGVVNDRYFMYVVAAGTFTEVSYRTDQKIKKVLGKLAYIVDGIKDVFNPVFTKVRIIADGVTIEDTASLLLVLNSKSVGGIRLNKDGHANDGLFDVVLVRKSYFFGISNIIRLFTFGLSRRKKRKYIYHIRAQRVYVETNENVVWCLDGEQGPSGNIEIINLPQHIRIFVSKNYKN